MRVKSAAIKFTLALRLYLQYINLAIFSVHLTTTLEEVDYQYFYFKHVNMIFAVNIFQAAFVFVCAKAFCSYHIFISTLYSILAFFLYVCHAAFI